MKIAYIPIINQTIDKNSHPTVSVFDIFGSMPFSSLWSVYSLWNITEHIPNPVIYKKKMTITMLDGSIYHGYPIIVSLQYR